MFNLLVAAIGTAWETDQLMAMDVSRFKEYSGSESNSISKDQPETLKLLEQIPALLMYELGADGPNTKVVRYGYLSEIRRSGDNLVFRFQERGHVSRSVIEEFADRLGMKDFEHCRTHWAVKDGNITAAVIDKVTPTPYGSKITEITRRAIVDALILRPKSFHGDLDYMDFLKRIWRLASMPSTDVRFDNAEGDIWKHTVANEDWSVSYLLFDYLKLGSCPDESFVRFIETALHPLVGNDEEILKRVSEINSFLRADGYRLVQTSEISGRPVFTAKLIGAGGNTDARTYEIVLSFAGEDREYVERVAEYLFAHGVEVFYDRYEEATLWGKDLAEHLDSVYRSHARYCVMFISKHYAGKVWTNHERKSALARALQERQEYILPARFDETELPGIRPTLGYVNLLRKSPDDLGRLILQKLGRHIPNEGPPAGSDISL